MNSQETDIIRGFVLFHLFLFNPRENITPKQLEMFMLAEQQILSYSEKSTLRAKLIRKLLDEHRQNKRD